MKANPNHVPTNLDYLRAHQYLYYCANKEVLTDREYDMFGRACGDDYKGGSDRASDYNSFQITLACQIVAGSMPVLPREYQP